METPQNLVPLDPRDPESGQAVTEYVFMLFFAVSAFLIVSKTLKPTFQNIQDGIRQKIENQLFSRNLHTFRP